MTQSTRMTASIVLVVLLTLASAALAESVGGQVVAAANGSPVRTALVVFLLSGEEKTRVATGDDGRFYVPELAPGVYTVRVSRGTREREYSGVKIPASQGVLRFEL